MDLSFSDENKKKNVSIHVLTISLLFLIWRVQYTDISNSQHVNEETYLHLEAKGGQILSPDSNRESACGLHMIKWELLEPMEPLSFKQ